MDHRPTRVLLIDDDPVAVGKLQALLSGAAADLFHLEVVASAQAQNRLADQAIELVLLSVDLTQGTGLDTLAAVRRRAAHRPIIVLAAHEDDEAAIMAVRLGAQDSLSTDKLNGCVLARTMRHAIERTRAMAAQQDTSSKKWRQIVESAPDIILTLDRSGTILFINRTVPGLTVERVTGSSAYAYLPADQHDNLGRALNQVFDTGQSLTYETAATGPHGCLAWYSVRVGPIMQDDAVAAAAMIVTDISERKQVRDNLARANEELQSRVAERTSELASATLAMEAIIQASPLAIYTIDPEGKVRSWN